MSLLCCLVPELADETGIPHDFIFIIYLCTFSSSAALRVFFITFSGGVAAYNFGVKNVQTWSRLDVGSTNNDFSNDVIARAQYLYQLRWN